MTQTCTWAVGKIKNYPHYYYFISFYNFSTGVCVLVVVVVCVCGGGGGDGRWCSVTFSGSLDDSRADCACSRCG